MARAPASLHLSLTLLLHSVQWGRVEAELPWAHALHLSFPLEERGHGRPPSTSRRTGGLQTCAAAGGPTRAQELTGTATARPGSSHTQHEGLIKQSGSRVPVFEDPTQLWKDRPFTSNDGDRCPGL